MEKVHFVLVLLTISVLDGVKATPRIDNLDPASTSIIEISPTKEHDPQDSGFTSPATTADHESGQSKECCRCQPSATSKSEMGTKNEIFSVTSKGNESITTNNTKLNSHNSKNLIVITKKGESQGPEETKNIKSICTKNKHIINIVSTRRYTIIGEIVLDINSSLGSFTIKTNDAYDDDDFYSDLLFVKITIKDENGKVVYKKAVEGTKLKTGTDEFRLHEGYSVEIYNFEPLTQLHPSDLFIDASNEMNTFVVTKYGLKNLKLSYDLLKEIIKKVDGKGKFLLENNSEKKEKLWKAICSLPNATRAEYVKKYFDLFPNIHEQVVKHTDVKSQESLCMNDDDMGGFSDQVITFLGDDDKLFAEFKTSRKNGKFSFSVYTDKPYEPKPDRLYARIIIKDEDGYIRFKQDVKSTNAIPGVEKHALVDGDIIEMYHAEAPKRLRSNEQIIDTRRFTNEFVVTKYGLRNVGFHGSLLIPMMGLNNDPLQDFIKKVDAEGKALLVIDSETKQELRTAICFLPEPYASEYYNKYAYIFPSQ